MTSLPAASPLRWKLRWQRRCGCAGLVGIAGQRRAAVPFGACLPPSCLVSFTIAALLTLAPSQDACSAVESSAALLGQLCERVLRAQAALGPADRAALLAAAPRFRRHASTEVVGQQGGAAWAGGVQGWGGGGGGDGAGGGGGPGGAGLGGGAAK